MRPGQRKKVNRVMTTSCFILSPRIRRRRGEHLPNERRRHHYREREGFFHLVI
jgi:hypothetical protein